MVVHLSVPVVLSCHRFDVSKRVRFVQLTIPHIIPKFGQIWLLESWVSNKNVNIKGARTIGNMHLTGTNVCYASK